MFIWFSEYINKRNSFMFIGLESMGQVVLLMLIMDRKTRKKRKGIRSIKTMERVLRKRVSRIRV